jgi:ADP-heptose:LPS heptosyltransferase
LHLAAAAGTRCIGLFGPTSARRNGPYGDEHLVIQKVHVGSAERKSLRTADNAAMLAISVEDVCAACDAIIAQNELDRAATVPRRALAA